MAAGLVPVTYRGRAINDSSPFTAYFVDPEGQAFNTFRGETVETTRPGTWPIFVRSQPDGLRFSLEIHILELSQANQDLLKRYFDPQDGEDYLVVNDNMNESPSSTRRILCSVESVVTKNAVNIYSVVMRASTGVWEANTASTPITATINNSGETLVTTAGGSTRDYPIFTITPKALIPATDSWTKFRYLVMVNRSPSALFDARGLGFPVMIDLSTYSITPGNDVRIFVDGRDQWRTINGNKLWFHVNFRPAKTFTLKDAITSTSSLNKLIASNTTMMSGWPTSEGYLLIDNEAIRYTSTDNEGAFSAQRGALGTTAATHAQGATAYWIEHPDMKILYGFNTAPAPNDSSDYQPVFDLASSSNTQWVYNSFTDYPATNRWSGGWREEFTEDNDASQYLTAWKSGTSLRVGNTKLLNTTNVQSYLANNWIRETPCGISGWSITTTTSGTVPSTADDQGNSVQGKFWRKIVTVSTFTHESIVNGYQTIEVPDRYSYNQNDDTTFVTQPAHVETFPTYEIVVTDQTDSETSNSIVLVRGDDLEHTEYTKILDGYDLSIFEKIFGPDATGVTFHTPQVIVNPRYSIVAASTTRTSYQEDSSDTSSGSAAYNTALKYTYYGTALWGGEREISATTGLSDIFALRLNTKVPLGFDSDGNLKSPHGDVVNQNTGAYVNFAAITLTFVTAYTPQIIVSAEQNLYLVNALRIEHSTTNEFIDLVLPAVIDEEFELDCEAHTLTEVATGRQLPSAYLASNSQEWLYNLPGSNTYTVTMTGISGGAGQIQIDETHRDRWL